MQTTDRGVIEPGARRRRAGVSLWEWGVVTVACSCALGLGFVNLGGPSLWHDEAVQVVVARNLLETGRPVLPSGTLHPVAPVFNAVLAAFIRCFGDSESVVRTPSVLFGACNVLLLWALARRLLDARTAAVAALLLAWSPWAVSWSREARFYSLQQTLYLVFLLAVWSLLSAVDLKQALRRTVGVAASYVLGLGISLHSVLFFAPVGLYAFLMGVAGRRVRSRWTVACLLVLGVGLATMVAYRLTLPKSDADAIFTSGGLGLNLDFGGSPRSNYFLWLWENLGSGFFVAAVAGSVWMWIREGRRGLFMALSFWAPVFALSVLLSYRIHRFMFFAFPGYIAAQSYVLVQLVSFVSTARTSRWRMVVAVLMALFLARLGLSEAKLLLDSLEVASDNPISLATRHPEWREPCLYVKERLKPDTAVVTTTFMPVYYYVGRVDDWFPSEHVFYEAQEAGIAGMKTTEEFAAFIARHSKGYYIAEWFRLWHSDVLAAEYAWVQQHLTLIPEACSGDVKVFGWGVPEIQASSS